MEDLPKNDKWKESFKQVRAKYLKDYLVKKKKEFMMVNKDIAAHLEELSNFLNEEYERQKLNLK